MTETTDDTLFSGRLTLRQVRRGHRAGTDAVLLQAMIPADAEGLAIDAGAASGAAGLMLAARVPALRVDLVEIDPTESALAAHNIAANGLSQRMHVITADLLASEEERERAGLTKEKAEIIITNPPFLREGAARLSPDPARARAHALPVGGLARWCRTLAWLAAPDAHLAMIHRVDAVPDILQALEGRFGAITLRAVHARAGESATRILVSGRKASRAPLQICPPLIVHDIENRFTREIAALNEGSDSIATI